MSAASARQTVLWAILTAGVFAAVLILSMLPRGEAAASPPAVLPARAAPQAPEGPGPAAPQAAAVNPWTQFTAPKQFTVRAEDVAELDGAMVLGSGPDNEGVLGPDGRRATVRFVWCPDDGCAEVEKEGEEPPGASGDHWAEFDMDVPADATYYPWARVWWQDSCGNSITVAWQDDGQRVASFDVQDGTLESWHWLPVAGVEGVRLRKGVRRLVVRNREDGARLSRIFFSGKSYESYKPETPEG